jgi:molybdopterin synthase catalytic subunit
MTAKPVKNIFVQGPISPGFIAGKIEKHQDKKGIGGHSIFLGQVRADKSGNQQVTAIEYTAYEEMALEQMQAIRESLFSKYDLECLHVYHSLGKVNAGEICLFVFTSAAHRHEAMESCSELVERIKKEIPVWGREIYGNETYRWKENL